ncbi:MAG: HD domain-containing protein [Nitrospirae bacterium]|nr:HD domain-containing protein [Nitrospirota bacterium]
MTGKELRFFKTWFSEYCGTFSTSVGEDRRNISLKEEHTFRVLEDSGILAAALRLDKEETLLAGTIALFHDLGRFPQYAQFRTFRDSISVNHAALGAEILSEKEVLGDLPEKERMRVIQAVKYHNAYALPDIPDGDTLFSLKLIRDADKLDIWRIFCEYYESPEEEKASAAGLGLPDEGTYSQEVLDSLFERKVVSLASLKTLDDFKLLQLSWIYDLNFTPSLNLLLERDYIQRIMKTLPRTGEILRAAGFLREYVRERLRKGSG